MAQWNLIRQDDLRKLASLVWEQGGEDIVRFVQLAVSDQALPI
jgi:hypothetical protein